MLEVEKLVVGSTEDVRKIGENNTANWQMDVVDFESNGCLVNVN